MFPEARWNIQDPFLLSFYTELHPLAFTGNTTYLYSDHTINFFMYVDANILTNNDDDKQNQWQ